MYLWKWNTQQFSTEHDKPTDMRDRRAGDMRAVVSQRQERCARGTRAKGGARGWPGGNLCHRAESSTVAHAERGHRWSGARWMRLLLLLLLLSLQHVLEVYHLQHQQLLCFGRR